jgi:hypothetical protein
MATTNSAGYASQVANRVQVDAQKSVQAALPIAGSTINTAAIDTEMGGTFPALELVDFVAIIPAANANTNNFTALTVQLQHSATNVSANFVNIPGTGSVSVNSANAATFPATTIILPQGDGTLQFVRLQVALGANGVNTANASNVTFQMQF